MKDQTTVKQPSISSAAPMSQLSAALLVGFVASLLSCSQHRTDFTLIPAPAKVPNADSERVRKSQLQLIQYYDYQSGSYVTGEAWTIAGLVANECNHQLGVATGELTDNAQADWCLFGPATELPENSGCESRVCAGAADLCTANLLKRLATQPGTVLTLYAGQESPYVRIEPQSTGANAALMILASEAAASAQAHELDTLDSMTFNRVFSSNSPYSGTSDCRGAAAVVVTPTGGTPTTLAKTATSVLVEASQLAEELTHDAANSVLASADAELSSSKSATLVQDRALGGATLSRGQAIRTLMSEDAYSAIAGYTGLEGLPDASLCRVSELSSQASRALQLLREAAPAPDDVLSTSSTEDFLDLDRAGGSIKQRLATKWGRTLGGTLYALMQLDAQDFADAREYLKQELLVFARSRTMTYATGIGSYARYASTATEPQDRDPAYWGAVARVHDQGRPDPGAQWNTFTPPHSFTENRYMAVREANLIANYVSLLPASERSIGDQLALLGSTLQARAPGYVRFDVNQSRTDVLVDFDNISTTTYLRVIAGEDGLHCATQGNIEGVPCSADQLASGSQCDWYVTSNGGYTCEIMGTPSTQRMYVVRSKNGGTGPGDYESVFGASPSVFTPADLGSDAPPTEYVRAWPIASDVDRQIADILKPDKHSCDRPRISCAGTTFDERMPLANELSSDTDPVESSWRYYLGLAKDAAVTADKLGSDLITSQLNVDLRHETVEEREESRHQDAEAAIAQLQEACGTNVDPMQLLLALSGTSDPTDLSKIRQRDASGATVSCSSNAACSGSQGYACLNGTCMKNPLDPAAVLASTTDPALKQALSRISECIGSDTVAPFVSLGTAPVCVWYPKDIPSQLCNSSSPSYPCPAFATAVTAGGATTYSCDSVKLPAALDASMTEVKLVDRQLGYFSSPSEPTPPAQICDELKSARLFPGDSSWLEHVIGTQIFHPYNLAALAPRIGWSAAVAGNATITLDGHALYGPRDSVYGNAGRLGWCKGCSTDADWARLDDRSLRAVVALRATTVGNLRGINVPFYVQTGDLAALTTDSISNVNYPGTNIPIQVTTKTYAQPRTDDALHNWPDGLRVADGSPPSFNQYHSDVSDLSVFATAWRAPLTEGGSIHEYPIRYAEDGRNYELAIGDMALLTDYGDYDNAHGFPEGRWDWWGHMSATQDHTVDGGIWQQYTIRSGGQIGSGERVFTPVPSYMPGARYVGYAGKKTPTKPNAPPPTQPDNGCTSKNGPFTDWVVPAECRDPANANPLEPAGGGAVCKDNPSGGHGTGCDYSVVPMHGQFEYTKGALLDAAELACAVGREVEEYKCDLAHPPRIQHPQDYSKAKAFMECAAREIQRKAGQTVLAGFPERAVDALRAVSSTGAYPAVGGTVGEDISHLRGALVQIAAIQGRMAYQMQSLGNDFETLSTALSKATIRDEVADTQFQSATSSEMNACGQAIAGVDTADFVSIPGRIGGAMLACSNAFAQIQFAGTLDDLTKDDTQQDRRQSVTEFRQRFADRALAFQGFAEDLGTQLEEIDARLASIEKNQQLARQALGRALYKASAAASSEAAVTTVEGNIAAVAQERYQRANKNAVRLAFLAKRAIENRLGVRLSSMRSDLPLVEAPVTWEASVCASTGVDYTALKKNVSAFQANTFADQFIGDYVSKLENVVESYRLANDFHEGDDTSIVSLRDDIFNVRAQCDAPSRNLITLSGQQNIASIGGVAGWVPNGCSGSASCVAVRKAPEVQGPGTDGELPSAGVFGLTFAAGTTLRKATSIEPGQYVLSWYSATSDGAAAATVTLLDSTGALVEPHTFSAHTVPGSNGFTRHVAPYNLTTKVDGWVSVSSTGTPEVLFAAPMLEARSDTVASDYQDVSASGTHRSMDCPDTTGETFRHTRWNHKCEQLCANGFADSCDGNAASSQCFWETSFAINQRGIESGDILNLAGFAKGNFNYRLSDVGLNFIGTGIQTCESSASPQTCASSGNLQYSLVHAGPYYVRNHDGADARIQLFEGHIEHARGLAAERSLTNPLSSTDSELLNQYMRTEFRGRPLDGNFTLRVWDKPGENFDAIQDIQLVLKYRYWTRFQ